MPAGLISIDIEARLAKLEEGVKRANTTLGTLDRTVAKVSSSASAALSGLASGFVAAFSVGAIAQFAKDVIANAEALQDLSDATGSTVEELSRLNNITKIGGGNFEEIKGALERLAAGLAGAEDGSSKTAEALRFLNIQAKDPAKALEEIALKLNKFADGASKAAIAKDLFGRAGVGFLATLKDIANNGDVAATVTTKQAEEATKLAEAFRRLSVESTAFSNAILSDVIPAILGAIREFRTGIEVAGGFFNALRLFGTLDLGKTAQKIDEITLSIAELEKQRTQGGLFSDFNNRLVDSHIADAQKQLAFLKQIQEQTLGFQTNSRRNADREVAALTKPDLAYKSGGAPGSTKEKISEAQRYLEMLQRQAEKLNELSAVETALFEIQKGRLKGITPEISAQIFAIAEQIDAFKRLEDEIKEGAKAFEEEARAAKHSSDERARAAQEALNEAASAAQANEQLRDEIAVILGGESARKALEKDYVNRAIARKEEALALLQQKQGFEAEAGAIESEIAFLKERKELLAGKDIAEAMRAQADAAKALADRFNEIGSSSFAQFLKDLTTGKPLDALKNLSANLSGRITDVIADRLSGQLFSKDGMLGGFGDFFASLVGGDSKDIAGTAALAGAGATLTASGAVLSTAGALLTTSAAALTAAAAAMGVSSSASSIGSIIGAFGEGTALAGYASGTDFVPRTQLALVHKGEAITPAHLNRGGAMRGSSSRRETHIHMYPPPGLNTQTARHMANQAVDRATSSRRRG